MRNPILVALDVDNLPDALKLVEQLREHVRGFKVGLELCMHIGLQTAIAAISAAGGELFVDLKYNDIPNTVAGAARAVTRPGVYMFNVHCNGGTAMMRAAAEVAQAAPSRPLALGVTMLTSIDEAILHDELHVADAMSAYVLHLAKLAQGAGLDGVVCSAHEVSAIKAACGANFMAVVPGVRPAWAETNDQKRTMTPAEAVKAGANFLVIGRPITRPPTSIGTPTEAAKRIMDEIAEA